MRGTRRIWKFSFSESVTPLTMRLPVDARIVHVDHQAGVLCLWAELDPDAARTERDFEVFGTGHALPEDATHVHSWQDGPLVRHLYELAVTS